MTTPHDIQWNDRLQDWLDGDLDAADYSRVAGSHGRLRRVPHTRR